MKFGKWLRRAAATAVAGCMVLSMSVPVLAETADALEEYGVQAAAQSDDAAVTKYPIFVTVGNNAEVQLDSSGPKTIGGDTFTYDPNEKKLTVKGDNGPLVIRIEEGTVDVNIQEYISDGLSVKGAHNVTYNGAQGGSGANNVLIECSGDVWQEDAVAGDLTVTGAKDVHIIGASLCGLVSGKATIRCSGTVEIQALDKTAMGFIGGLDFTQSAGSDCVYWYVDEKADATGEGTPIGSTLTLASSELTKLGYLKIVPLDNGTDDTVTDAAAPAGDAGGAVAAAVIGTAAVWGGYEAATRIILNSLLPEGAAIPKTQAQLAVLLWNTAGQPEPAGAPAFADVDDATAKAAQWCAEQGYLTGTFKPEKRVAKFNVIRTWNKAFPKN